MQRSRTPLESGSLHAAQQECSKILHVPSLSALSLTCELNCYLRNAAFGASLWRGMGPDHSSVTPGLEKIIYDAYRQMKQHKAACRELQQYRKPSGGIIALCGPLLDSCCTLRGLLSMIYRYTHTTPACWKCPLQGLPLGSFHIAECSAHEGGMGLCLAIASDEHQEGWI